jgi:cytoskeletal protein RodZ
MHRYLETRAKEPQEPGIDPLSQVVDGKRVAPREALRLERGSFLLAALGHAILLSAIVSRLGVVQFAPAENESVEVAIVTTLEIPAARSSRPTNEPAMQQPDSEPRRQATPTPAATPPTVNAPTKSAMIKATEMLSGAMLADSRSQETRQALAQMNVEERTVQICSIEAMGQIAKSNSQLSPELVSSYAVSEIKFKGRVVVAQGAAFQSNGIWYNLAFSCQISPDRARVQSFEFAVGDPIPRSKWSSLNLTSSHGLPLHD